MICIGNDIIDLKLARLESNIFRKGYLDKILSSAEQKTMFESEYPWLQFWIFWSQKEAVYKLIRQKGENRGFYPFKIEIQNSDIKLGKVCFKNQIYYTQTKVNDDRLETISLEDPNNFNRIKSLNSNMQFLRNDEIPFIEMNKKKQALSKSHHGRFESCVSVF